MVALLSALLLLLMPLGESSVEADYEKYIGEIPPECVSDIASPRELLPDKDIFVAIKKAMLMTPFNKSFPFLLGAGRGKSGTTFTYKMCVDIFPKHKRCSLHFNYKSTARTHSEVYLMTFLREQFGMRRRRQIKGEQDSFPSITSEAFLRAVAESAFASFSALATMDPPLGCLLDNPWTQYFTELFYASCPNVKVFLNTRESVDWAKSRMLHHNESKLVFICPFHREARYDPFSLPQCAHSPAMLKAQPMRGEVFDNGDLSIEELAAAYRKYNRYVKSIVPESMFFEINFFLSRYIPTINGTTWTAKYFEMLKMYLTDGDRASSPPHPPAGPAELAPIPPPPHPPAHTPHQPSHKVATQRTGDT